VERVVHFRSSVGRFLVAMSAICVCVSPTRASAELIWNWSFGGTEAGTFTTDGTPADATIFNAFTITDFQVTASTVNGLVGRPYVEVEPTSGFAWYPSFVDSFFRDSMSLWNGMYFFVSDAGVDYQFFFYADAGFSIPASGLLRVVEGSDVVPYSLMTLAISVAPVPEIDPAGMGSVLALVTGTLGLLERRRLKVA
jgi:hypothetical protein